MLDASPSYVLPPLASSEVASASAARATHTQSARPYRFRLGTAVLTNLWDQWDKSAGEESVETSREAEAES